jgi:hypothetical protein
MTRYPSEPTVNEFYRTVTENIYPVIMFRSSCFIELTAIIKIFEIYFRLKCYDIKDAVVFALIQQSGMQGFPPNSTMSL